MTINLFDVQKMLQSCGVLISFSGRFSQEIIEELGEAVKKHLETDVAAQNHTYNVFSVLIEQTQNIKNYSMMKLSSPLADRIGKSGIVAIGKTEGGYYVSSGNLIATQDMAALQARLDAIIAQDKAGLKKMYKEQMKQDMTAASPGAGLGLIDMARKSSRPLQYSMVRQDDEVSFFTLKAQV